MRQCHVWACVIFSTLLLVVIPINLLVAKVASADTHEPLKPLATLGRGYINDLAWSPDGATLAVATSVGVWLYNTRALDAEPRFFIRCTQFDFLAPYVEKARTLGWEVFELASGHDAMITRSQELSAILLEIATQEMREPN